MSVAEVPDMIKRPRCPKCQIRMMLVGIEPSFAGPDLRTFECPRCELTYKALVALIFHAGSNAFHAVVTPRLTPFH
jgi:hypothetical protein